MYILYTKSTYCIEFRYKIVNSIWNLHLDFYIFLNFYILLYNPTSWKLKEKLPGLVCSSFFIFFFFSLTYKLFPPRLIIKLVKGVNKYSL